MLAYQQGEERIREEIQGVSDASGACLGDEDVMAVIVGESGRARNRGHHDGPMTRALAASHAPQQVARGDGWVGKEING